MEDAEFRDRDKRLYDQLASASEVVQVEYRHRHDQAYSVVHVAKDIWEAIEELSATLKRHADSKWRKVWPATLFYGGALLSWLLAPQGEFKFNTGTYMMIAGAIAYVAHALETYFSERRLQALREQETGLLFQWLSSGASDRSFWRYRDLELRKLNLFRVKADGRKDTDSAISSEMWELQLEMREDHFNRAAGDRLERKGL